MRSRCEWSTSTRRCCRPSPVRTVTGVTVHFANQAFDSGPVIAQETVEIRDGDTLETLEARIHAVEHRLYPAVLAALAEDRVTVEGRRVRILPR
jgi:phosphoribosylglycinamide formyltransferase-1